MIVFKYLYLIVSVCFVIFVLGKLARQYMHEQTSFTWLAFIVATLNALLIFFYSILCSSINVYRSYKLCTYILISSVPIFPILLLLTLNIIVEYNQRSEVKKILKFKNFFYILINVTGCFQMALLFLLIYIGPALDTKLLPFTVNTAKYGIMLGWSLENTFLSLSNIMNLAVVNFLFACMRNIQRRRIKKDAQKKHYRIIIFNTVLTTLAVLNDIILVHFDIILYPPITPIVVLILLLHSLKIIQDIPNTKILPQVFSLNIFDTLEDGIAFINLNYTIIYVNAFLSVIFEEDLLYKNLLTILPDSFKIEKLKDNYVGIIQISTSKKKYVRMNYAVQRDRFGDLIGGIIVFQDYTDVIVEEMSLEYETHNINKIFAEKNKQLIRQNNVLKSQLNRRNYLQEEYIHLLQYDTLTQVYTRAYFFEMLEKKIKSGDEHFAVFSIDISDFKYLNDIKGHWLGDLVLIEVAKNIKQFLADDGILARADGDNFLLLHNNIKTKEELAIFSRLISNVVSDIKAINDLKIYISISIGICMYEQGMHADDLVNNAELANLQAGFERGKKYVIFTSEISHSISERFKLISEIKKSCEHSDFLPFYQPQVLVNRDGSQKISGYESLARWNHPDRGLLSPYFFIGVAEASGMIVTIGYAILRKACHDINCLVHKGCTNFKISVNLSAKQLNSENFIKTVREIFTETKVNTSYLEFEITETELLVYNNRILSKCIELKAMGISIAIDDFGVAFASFNYIKTLPIDKMKIDKSFIDDIGVNKRTEQILYVVLEFAKVCNLDVVVEGVEHKYQLDFLLKQTNDIIIQGYYYYKPMPFETILHENIFPHRTAQIGVQE